MKKILALALVVMMLISIVACGGTNPDSTTDNSTSGTTATTDNTTATTGNENPAVVEKGTIYKAFEEFNTTASNQGVWQYMFSGDNGKTFDPTEDYHDYGTYGGWHPWEGSYIGVGFNHDVEGFLELNTDQKSVNFSGQMGVLVFVAPAAGKYVVTSAVWNKWEQDADVFTIAREDGTILLTKDLADCVDIYGYITPTDVTLAAGEKLYIYCNAAGSSWMSAYIQPIFYYEPTDDSCYIIPEIPHEEKKDFFPSADAEYSATKDFSESSNPNGVWAIVSTLDGKTWTVVDKFEKPDWNGDGNPDAAQWYSAGGTGAGFNYDVKGYLEANVTDVGGETMGIAFIAPADGTYTVAGYARNFWGQNGSVAVTVNGTVVATAEYNGDPTEFTYTAALKAGDMVVVHGVSNGGWLSTYLDVYAGTSVKLTGEWKVVSGGDEPEPEEWAPSAEAEYSATKDFSETSNPNGVWVFVSSNDGKTWTTAPNFDKPDWDGDGAPNAAQWYSNGGTGCGFNYDVKNFIEANVTDAGGEMMGIAFVAPADGTYTVAGYAKNFWNQSGYVVITVNGEDVVTADYKGEPTTYTYTAALKAGDMVVVHGVSNGGWLSTYLDVYAGTSVKLTAGYDTKYPQAEYSATKDFSETSNPNGVWVIVSTSDCKTWTTAPNFDKPDWNGDGNPDAAQWYSANGTGCGFNYDVKGYVEANVTDVGGEIMGIAFVAPADGNYTVAGTAKNFWNQNGSVAVTVNGAVVATADYTDAETEFTYTADLKAGDMVVVHGISNGGWLSTYLDVYAWANLYLFG